MSRLAILNWKQEAAARRDFRAGRGSPEVPPGRHRRKPGGCKKARDDQHVWGEPDRHNFSVTGEPHDKDLSYTIERCTLCGKKRWTFDEESP